MNEWTEVALEIWKRLTEGSGAARGKALKPIPVPALTRDAARKLRKAAQAGARR
jgi:hypothetical protein